MLSWSTDHQGKTQHFQIWVCLRSRSTRLNRGKLSTAVLAAAQQATEHSSYQMGLVMILTQMTRGSTCAIPSIAWLASLGPTGVACAAEAVASWACPISCATFDEFAERSLHEEPARRQVKPCPSCRGCTCMASLWASGSHDQCMPCILTLRKELACSFPTSTAADAVLSELSADTTCRL